MTADFINYQWCAQNEGCMNQITFLSLFDEPEKNDWAVNQEAR
jgi:hypothetical protein